MIIDAIVIARGSNEHTWKVAIPLFGGFPDSQDEADIYNKIKGMESFEDYYGNPIEALIAEEVTSRPSDVLLATTVSDLTKIPFALKKVITAKEEDKEAADVREYTRLAFNTVLEHDNSDVTDTDFTVEATVCETPGLADSIKVGDTVYIGFYKGDMGNPVILGLRWHATDLSLPACAQKYEPKAPNITAGTLTAEGQVTLSANCTFKDRSGATMTFAQIKEAVTFYNEYKDLIVSLTTHAESLLSLASKASSLLGALTPPTT